MSIYQRLLGHPFVYNRIRPLVVGGIDWSPLYRNLESSADDVVLDVGCGTGVARDYLGPVESYFGYDTDPVAIEFARRHKMGPNVSFECAVVAPQDIAAIRPTRIILAGLLHHLSDADSLALLRMCAQAPSVKRVATSDVVYLPGKYVSNVLAYFDRGKFVRRPQQYLDLINQAGLRVVRQDVVRSHPTSGKALYFMTALEPAAPAAAG